MSHRATVDRAARSVSTAEETQQSLHDIANLARDSTTIDKVAPAIRPPTWRRLLAVILLQMLNVWLSISYVFFIVGFDTSPYIQIQRMFGPMCRLAGAIGSIALMSKGFLWVTHIASKVASVLEGRGEPPRADAAGSRRPGLGYHRSQPPTRVPRAVSESVSALR